MCMRLSVPVDFAAPCNQYASTEGCGEIFVTLHPWQFLRMMLAIAKCAEAPCQNCLSLQWYVE